MKKFKYSVREGGQVVKRGIVEASSLKGACYLVVKEVRCFGEDENDIEDQFELDESLEMMGSVIFWGDSALWDDVDIKVSVDDGSPLSPVHCTLEPCVHNTDGFSCTVYFEGPSAVADATAAFGDSANKGKWGSLSPDNIGKPWPLQNDLTKRLRLTGWQCYAG